MNLQIQAGYFSLKNPLQILEQWLNPYHLRDSINVRGKNMDIMYTKRAEKALLARNRPLTAELQLYFTCVVQKHVLFHEFSELETQTAKNNLQVAFHTVQSEACDPVKFAEKHPVKKELSSKGAKAMRPSLLKIDHKDGCWTGDFSI